MSHQVCHDVGHWVESNVQQQVEQCVEQDCNWWCACCNKWLCGLVWVIVNVVTWVVETVCEVVADVWDLVVNIVKGLWDIVAGIFTWDGTRVLGGLIEIFGGAVAFVLQILSIVTLGTLVGVFVESANAWALRDYAHDLLKDKYGDKDPKGLEQMEDALGINSGGFGLRLKVEGVRTFIRSDFSSRGDGVPDLIDWVQNHGVDLKSLAGFNPPAWWSREWPELVGDSGDISESDIDAYIAAGGVGDVKHFSVFCMSKDDMQTRLDCAEQHASEIGLVLQTSITDKRIESFDQILVNRALFSSVLKESPFNRHNTNPDAAVAIEELCHPIAIGVFGFTEDGAMGQSAHLANSTCLEAGSSGSTNFQGQGITGACFRNRKPDEGFKYTAIHELGHTFGLCHVDNILRIMYTGAKAEGKHWYAWGTIWHWWNSGTEATFILDEGKKVWDYIVANFAAACLETRQF